MSVRPILRQSDNSEAALRLRPLDAGDVTILSELWVASWQDAMTAIDFTSRRPWIEARLRDFSHTTIVATSADALLGFASYMARAPDRVLLEQLVVASAVKGRGVATELLKAVKAASATGLCLDVNQANARAVRFYLREGFTVVASGSNPNSGLATWHMVWRGCRPASEEAVPEASGCA